MHSFEKYVEKRFETILLLLAKPRMQWTPFKFHQFRVEIKKLRAIFEVIKACNSDFKRRKNYKPLRLLFRQAGKIRELQLEKIRLNAYFNKGLFNNYKIHLDEKIKEEKNTFFLLVQASSKQNIKKREKKSTRLVSNCNKKNLALHMAENRNAIQMLLHDPKLKTSSLHALRSMTKKFVYNMHCLSDKVEHRSLTNTIKLADLIGKWHDLKLCIKQLKKAKTTLTFNNKENVQCDKVLKNFESELKSLSRQIKTAIPQSELFEYISGKTF